MPVLRFHENFLYFLVAWLTPQNSPVMLIAVLALITRWPQEKRWHVKGMAAALTWFGIYRSHSKANFFLIRLSTVVSFTPLSCKGSFLEPCYLCSFGISDIINSLDLGCCFVSKWVKLHQTWAVTGAFSKPMLSHHGLFVCLSSHVDC